jgi:uncharacterized RDD family membrane protein YckC
MHCPRCGAWMDGQSGACANCGNLSGSVAIGIARPAEPARPPPINRALAPGAVAYAGFWRRLAARIIDCVVLFIAIFVVAFAAGLLYGVERLRPRDVWIIVTLATFASVWLYYTVFECSALQATPGKLALRMIVTDSRGRRVSFRRANGRFFGKIISGMVLGIGYYLVGFTVKKQTLHDILADCVVVLKKPSRGGKP